MDAVAWLLLLKRGNENSWQFLQKRIASCSQIHRSLQLDVFIFAADVFEFLVLHLFQPRLQLVFLHRPPPLRFVLLDELIEASYSFLHRLLSRLQGQFPLRASFHPMLKRKGKFESSDGGGRIGVMLFTFPQTRFPIVKSLTTFLLRAWRVRIQFPQSLLQILQGGPEVAYYFPTRVTSVSNRYEVT